MSVIKANRAESPFHVLANAHDIRKELYDLFYRNFGYKKRKVKLRKANGDLKTEEELKKDLDRAEADYQYYTWMLDRSRDHIDDCLRSMGDNIVAADAIYPATLAEYDDRRRYQDQAIANCFQILQELQFVLETMLFDINKFTRYADMLKSEIVLLRAWRKSDNKIRRTIRKREQASDEE